MGESVVGIGALFGIALYYIILYSPIVISVIFLLWRLLSRVLEPGVRDRANLKAPLTAFIVNGVLTAFIIAMTSEWFGFVGLMDESVLYIGPVLSIITILLWISDSKAWNKNKSNSKYLTAYKIASACLITLFVFCGVVTTLHVRNERSQQDAAELAAVRSVGTQLYLPRDTDVMGIDIYVYPTSDKKHSYIDTSKTPMAVYQYSNISIPSKLHCYPDNPSLYDPNKTDEPSGCTYMGKINGMEVWGYTQERDDHPEYDDHRYAYKIQYIFAHIGTTTVTIDYTNNTPNSALSYIKSLRLATDEEILKYPIQDKRYSTSR